MLGNSLEEYQERREAIIEEYKKIAEEQPQTYFVNQFKKSVKKRTGVEKKTNVNKVRDAVAMINQLKEEQRQATLQDRNLGPPTGVLRTELKEYLNHQVERMPEQFKKQPILPEDIREKLQSRSKEDKETHRSWTKPELRKLAHRNDMLYSTSRPSELDVSQGVALERLRNGSVAKKTGGQFNKDNQLSRSLYMTQKAQTTREDILAQKMQSLGDRSIVA